LSMCLARLPRKTITASRTCGEDHALMGRTPGADEAGQGAGYTASHEKDVCPPSPRPFKSAPVSSDSVTPRC
jgi:hypothetical protein